MQYNYDNAPHGIPYAYKKWINGYQKSLYCMNSESLNNGRAIQKLLRASLCAENIKCMQNFFWKRIKLDVIKECGKIQGFV